MKYRVPVAYRIHEGLVVAQALAGLRISAAGATEEDARTRLTRLLADTLGRLHPRRLAGMDIPFSFASRRLDVPVFEVDLGAFTREGGQKLAMPVDVVTADVGAQFELVGAPQFGTWMWLAAGEGTEYTVERLQKKLEPRARTTRLHGPTPQLFRVEDLEVEFEPLDVREVELDTLWLDALPPSGQGDGESGGKLEEVAESWTSLSPVEQAQRGIEPMFDHESSLEQLEEMLRAAEPTAVVLVGPHRVGKTSHIRHLSAKWAAGPAPEIWFADPPRLVSADVMSGGWQQQAASVVEEIAESGDVLYMGRLVQALDAGKYFGSDYNLAQFLKPQLAELDLRIVAEATPEEWARIEQRDVGFARAFN
ncbi:MAG: hypothetical protein ACQEVA_21070, partial [Myxococcota bacterium]